MCGMCIEGEWTQSELHSETQEWFFLQHITNACEVQNILTVRTDTSTNYLWVCSVSVSLHLSVADVSHSGLFFGPSSFSRFRDLGFAWSRHRTRAPYLAFAVFSQLIAPSSFFFFSFFSFSTTPTIVFRAQLRFHSSHIRMETFILRMTSVVNFPIT